MAAPSSTRRRPALERVLRTADQLFYANGIHATGVDTIAETADVSRTSMYMYFHTNDDLVTAYLDGRSRSSREHVAAQLDQRAETPAEKVLLVYDLLATGSTDARSSTPRPKATPLSRPTPSTCSTANGPADCSRL